MIGNGIHKLRGEETKLQDKDPKGQKGYGRLWLKEKGGMEGSG
jgi:hypothetical protein